ncbi:MAG TPA: DegV family protein, partial [Rectinemataceae bacterium]|nr:DegV family protein [Rectinemataceae bacterium]
MKTLDGYQLYGFFHAGFRRVHAARQHIDRINVFPVPDGDTGTNLSSTLSGALEATIPGSSAAITLAALADAAILSARGNSGVIFAQFISGLSESVRNTELRTHELIDGVHNAYLRAKEAVTEPRDGTILSVIETWAVSLARQGPENSSIVELIGATREDLRRSLAETTDKLAELKAAGVVDAGAAGFVEFVVGGHEFLEKGLETPNDATTDDATPIAEHSEAAPSEPPVFRYCVEAIVGGESIDTETLRADLAPSGDCLIIAAGKRRAKIHVHSDDPGGVMSTLSRFGPIMGPKADDMLLQYRDAHERKAGTAIVTDSSCDLSPELIERHRIHIVPLLILAGGSEYLDKLTIDPERLREFSEGDGIFPRTSQPPAPFFSRLFANLSSHYDNILAIHLASPMSGTFAASRKEADKTGEKVLAFDSRHLSGSLGLIVLRAAEAAEGGASREEILSHLDEWSKKARIL